jgi:cyclase
MKARIIPSILTNGINVVKGSEFNNWRTVGNVEAIARLFANRNIDELLFLDVEARSRRSLVSIELIDRFSQVLNIPFSIGGGINTKEDAANCLRAGAEKIVLGTAAVMNPNLISEIANQIGSQAVVVAVDMRSDINGPITYHSGKMDKELTALEFISKLEGYGAGEILLQSVHRDGTMSGLDINSVQHAVRYTNIPIILSGGCSSAKDAISAIYAGASAVAVGALFQYTENTPQTMAELFTEEGIRTRKW